MDAMNPPSRRARPKIEDAKMRVGRDTRSRIEAIKEEMDEPIQKLQMYLARLEEHAGTKRMTAQLRNAVEKLERWKNTQHF